MRSTRRRFIRLSGLAGAAALLGLPKRASWAATTARTGRLRLVFFTDVHASPEFGAPAALELVPKAINRRRADLVIGGGDLIYDGFEANPATAERQWKLYMEMHRAIKAPVEPALGNHDLVAVRPDDGSKPAADPRATFREAFAVAETWRSVDADGCRVLFLDSVDLTGDDRGYRGWVGPGQLDWIRHELGRTDTDTPIVAVTHIPLLSAIPQAVEGAAKPLEQHYIVGNNAEVLELFRDHNLALVLQGHLHAEEMIRWRGTTFITGGAVCGGWWRGPRFGTPEGFGVVTLRSGRVEWEYRTYGWAAKET